MNTTTLLGNNNIVIATSNDRIRERLTILRSYVTSIKKHKKCMNREELEDYLRIIKEISNYTMYTNISFYNEGYITLPVDGFLFNETPQVLADKILEKASAYNNCIIEDYFNNRRGIKVFINVCNYLSFLQFLYNSKTKDCKIKEVYTKEAIDYYLKTDNGCLDSFYVANITCHAFRQSYNN